MRIQLIQAYIALTDPKLKAFLGRRSSRQTAPFAGELYEEILTRLRAQDVDFPAFVEPGKSGRASIYVRHDVDTTPCIEKIQAMTAIDEKLNIPASVYFRVDDEDYHLGDHREIPQAIAVQGLEVGLHTSCYVFDNPLARFKLETEKFADESGIRPTSFTLHGFGARNLKQRVELRNHMAKNLGDYGYRFTDCHRSLRKYRYVVEDCHIQPGTGERFIYDDVDRVDELISKPANYLILSHPCYWSF